MRFVQPKVFLTYQSQPNKGEVRSWLDFIGADEYDINWDAVTAGEQLVQLAGKRCYMSFQVGLNPNITRVRTDMADFIDNILKIGHGSVLAHAWYTFNIENLSRVATAELNRHGVGSAISEGSMRYILYNDIPMVEVDSLIANDPDPEVNALIELDRADIKEHAEFTEKIYERMKQRWITVLQGKDFTKKKHLTSRSRRIIPMGVATGGVWSYNLRSLRNIFELRCSAAAEEEILAIACMMLEIMMKTEPNVFKDFQKNAEGFYVPKYHKV